MSAFLQICRDLSWLSPRTGTRVALALLDLYALPTRVRYAAGLALSQTVAALQEHDPDMQARREWANRVISDIVADLKRPAEQRKREAN